MDPAINKTPSVYEVRILLESKSPPLLVVNRKGVITHASYEAAATLLDKSGHGRGAAFGGLHGMGSFERGGGDNEEAGECTGVHTSSVYDGSVSSLTLPAAEMSSYTIFDFMPYPWKDICVRLTKVRQFSVETIHGDIVTFVSTGSCTYG